MSKKKTKDWAEAVEAGMIADLTTVPTKALRLVAGRGCLCDQPPCPHTGVRAELERRGTAKVRREAELDRDLTAVREELDRTRRELAECRAKANPPEPEEGSVVRFGIKYRDPGRSYSYAAYRVGGEWYVTGSINGFTSGSWGKLCETIRATDIGVDKWYNGELRLQVAGPWKVLS